MTFIVYYTWVRRGVPLHNYLQLVNQNFYTVEYTMKK